MVRPSSSFALLLLLAGCHKAESDPRTLPPLVAVITLTGAQATGARFTGVVRARVESELGFRIAGKVVERLVDAGQTVHRGQPLARLDPTDLALGAAAQVADLAGLRARSVQADVDLKRLAGLVEQGAVSAQSYDQAKLAADAARAQLAASAAQSRISANARGYAVLVADADGVVEETSAEPGQVVAAGQTVVKLAHAGPREAAAALPETVRPAVGALATGTLYGASGGSFPARLRQLSQNADPATRTFEARYVLQGAGATAPLGTTVTLTLPGVAANSGVEAPLGAIYDPGSGPGVWRVEGGRVHFAPVRLLQVGVDGAKISGLGSGLRIVALGADRLREGQSVRTTPLPGATLMSAAP